MRRTKIICTIGPATESPEKIKQLLDAGMNVARLNFSHGDYDEHGARMKNLKAVADKYDYNLGILLDTKGPEIRTGIVPDPGITLENGQKFVLDNDQSVGSSERVYVTYENLWREVTPGTQILLDDGLMDLEVTSTETGKITTVVRNGGVLKSKKGVNVPDVSIQLPALTQKDIDDIEFGLKNGIDFIAASFTRKPSDIIEIGRAHV